MKNIWTIIKRELGAYFNVPIAYIFIIVFLLMSNGLYMSSFFLAKRADMRAFFAALPWILIIFIPAITMRLWAEERKIGTIGLLQSLPIPESHLVIGKFLASFIFYIIALLGTIPIPIMLKMVGEPDMGPILGGYFGSMFLGAFYLAIGIFISAFFTDQIIAFILSMVACFAFYMLGTDYIASFIDGWLPGVGSFISRTIGLESHFSSIERGVIDLKDIIYFLSYTIIFLILNAYTLESKIKLKKDVKFGISVCMMLGIGILINLVISGFRTPRFDLTEGKIYTLSPSTKKILSKLKDVPLRITYYVSPKEKMPTAMKTLEQDVRDKIREIQMIKKNIKFKVINPEQGITGIKKGDTAEIRKKIQERLKRLEERGIVPFDVQSIERDSFNIKRVYSAISISYLDKKEEIIPQIIPQNLNNLEYELVSKIYRLTLEKKPKVTVVAPYEYPDPRMKDPNMRKMLQQMGQPLPQPKDNFKLIVQLLREQGYEVNRTELTKDNGIDKDTTTVVVLQPEDMNRRQVYELNKALVTGKKLFVAVQKHIFNYMPSSEGGLDVFPIKINTGIDDFLKNIGVIVSNDFLMDANSQMLSIPTKKNIGGFLTATLEIPVKLPIQILIIGENMNKEVSITNQIPSLFYLWGSSIEVEKDKLKDHKLKYTILATTGKYTWIVKEKTGSLTASDIDPQLHEFTPNLPVAIMLEGQFPDMFKGKNIPAWPKKKTPYGSEEEEESESKQKAENLKYKPSKLILTGCSYMFNDMSIGGGAAGNALFFLNCVDALTLGDDLIKIRAKSQTLRFIEEVTASEKLFYKFFTVLLVPILIAIIGIIKAYLRRKAREEYIRSLSLSD